MSKYFLGIDIGTSSCKAVIIDERGRGVGRGSVEIPISMPQPLWSEQNPEEWWKAAVWAIQSAAVAGNIEPRAITAIGLTGQMHGLTLLDAAGAVLRPAILWNDQRTVTECEGITQRVGAQRVIELTGNPVLTGFTAPKLLWVRRHEPQVYSKIAHWLLPKDYVRFRLSGEFHGDVSDASGTALFDVGRRCWSDEMLAALDLPRAWLAEISESTVASTRVSADAARLTHLTAGTPIVAGAGDQAAQAVGTGIVEENAVSVTIGTSGVVFAAFNQYRVDPQGRLHSFCHAVPGMWHQMGVMLSAGGSFEWLCNTLGPLLRPNAKLRAAATPVEMHTRLLEAAAQAPPGCDGLTFLPYLTGERTPHADPLARGGFVGLTPRHGLPHLARAVLEGVSFGLRDSLELMRAGGATIRRVRVSGGGARSPLWRQILADVFGCEVVSVDSGDGAAYGAALLSAVGAGVFADVRTAAAGIQETERSAPGADQRAYEAAYERFRALYPALRPWFQAGVAAG